MKSQLHSLITEVLRSKSDTLDWGKVLFLNDKLKEGKKYEKFIYAPIKDIAAQGNIKEKMNSIELVDSFFKNGTVESQKSLQTNVPIIFSIDSFCNEPVVHMNFCKAVQNWAQICQKNRCLIITFINWMKKLYSFKFKYVMTPEISQKFTNDFNTAHEFLLLVSNELINAKHQRTNSDLNELEEMSLNVVDVHQRLTALEKTASSRKFISIIQYLEYYCCVCIHAYESLKKNGTFEEEILLEIEAQGMPGQKANIHKTPNHHRQSLSNYGQNTMNYVPPPERPKSQAYTYIENPSVINNNSNPYQQLQMNEYYYLPPSSQPNIQLEKERQQVQQLYSTHLQQQNANNDADDMFSWSQYPSVTPNTFNFDPNANYDNQDNEELPPPPFVPPPYVPPPYAPPPYIPPQ